MDWHYAHDGKDIGPVDEAEVVALAASGTITPETLVWHAGMADWQPYGQVLAQGTSDVPPGAPPGTGSAQVCIECGGTFSTEDMVRYGGSWVCAACKPVFFQRLSEGGAMPREMRYGGFWIRFSAKFIDGMILGVAGLVCQFSLGWIAVGAANEPSMGMMAMQVLLAIVQCAVSIGYETWFVGRFGATLGKMACGLKVVTSDGERVTYSRAFGRCLATFLSAIILNIGYIMAAFDDQKRALHDRICDTRVVYK